MLTSLFRGLRASLHCSSSIASIASGVVRVLGNFPALSFLSNPFIPHVVYGQLVAIAFVWLITGLNILGTRKSGNVQLALTWLKVVLIVVIAAVITITQGVRKITVQYAKRVVGRKMYGGQTQYMPLKVNYAGVMPIIFAWALLLFPATIVQYAFKNSPTANRIASALSTGWPHYVALAAMIFFFSYFWVATQFQPAQIADDLKKYGGYIPGVRPGKPTADFLDFTMTRLTFAGAIFLTLIAVLPSLLSQGLNVPMITAQFFGGTSLLIIVGVMLDTMRQVETHLIQRHYDGFLRKGRIRGRAFGSGAYSRGETAASGTLLWLYVGIAVLFIAGVAIFLYGR
jgi:preprotein translocase subunit SecY